MRALYLALPAAAALLACTAVAQVSPEPRLAQPPKKEGPVPGWFLSGMNSRAYEIAIDTQVFHGGEASATIHCSQRRCSSFGTLMQTIQADPYIGHCVHLSAWVKATKVGSPRLWMRIDGTSGEQLAFDNMDNRAKSGPFEWRSQEIVLNVMPPAATIHFGLILDGSGAAWIDDMALDMAPGACKRTTNMLSQPVPYQRDPMAIRRAYNAANPHPRNLDFEERLGPIQQ
jgi:hypothetical protein